MAESERGVQRARTRKGILRATILPSCQASNLLFSVPHRLLIMALCRQLLVGITTLEELLNGDRKFIEVCIILQNYQPSSMTSEAALIYAMQIKPEYFDDSIFFTSGPRGLSISTGPQTSIGFTDYLRTRGQRMGYEGELSWYGIRRRAASDIARRVGAKAAREIMNHNPDSVVLEESSFDLDETREVAAIALNEPVAANGQYAALIAA